ncbi:MAG TPA: DMT family transporter [Acidimicrobiales bacterium]|nr:DMT family transporter [Acidimicrobiales bacterium]
MTPRQPSPRRPVKWLGAAFLIPGLFISEIVAPPRRGHLGLGTGGNVGARRLQYWLRAYILNFQVIDAADSSTAAGVAYLSPIAVVIVGMVFLGEHLFWYEPVGAVVILLGVMFSQGRIIALARHNNVILPIHSGLEQRSLATTTLCANARESRCH